MVQLAGKGREKMATTVKMSTSRTKNLNHIHFLIFLLLFHSFLLGYNAWWMSPTLDEPAYVVAGISHWRYGDFSLYRVNPPLVRMVATVPAILLGYKFEFPDLTNEHFGRPEFPLGEEFIHANGRWSLWLMTLGRLACLPFSLLGAVVCYRWAKELYGSASGLLACSLWCFSPMVLGHAALLTPDAHAAALGTLACYSFWRWLQVPTWQQTIATGVILGLAELSKTTLILLYPIWPMLWLLYRWLDRSTMPWRCWRNEVAMLALRMVIGLYVINLCYLGNGSFLQLKEYTFVSELFGKVPNADGKEHWTGSGNRFRQSLLAELPVPLPYDYVKGIDVQQRDFEGKQRPSYLRGRFQEQGWWYYYAYASLIKTPLGTWGLILLAIYWRWSHPVPGRLWRDEFVLLAPAAIVFIVVSSKTGFSHHYRYVFPCLPLVMIWISQVASILTDSPRVVDRNHCRSHDKSIAADIVHLGGPLRTAKHCGIRSVAMRALAALFLTTSITSSLCHFPFSLSYFNEVVGGPKHGAEHLIYSNIDWGQDLLYLEHWAAKQSIHKPVYLAFDNCFNPFDLGIPNIAPWPLKQPSTVDQTRGETVIPDGYYAISLNQLYEFPWPLRELDGTRYYLDTHPLKCLRSMRPIRWVGYSIRVYSEEQIRAAYNSQELVEQQLRDQP